MTLSSVWAGGGRVERRLAERLFAAALTQARAATGDTLVARLTAVLAAKLELTLRLWRDSQHAGELLATNARLCGDLSTDFTAGMRAVVAGVLADTGPGAELTADVALALVRGLEADPEDPDPDLLRRQLRHGVALLVAGHTHNKEQT